MTDCIHRRKVIRKTHMMCGNQESKARGVLPLSTCDSCQYRAEKLPDPPKKLDTPETLHFVWVYWQGGARGDELRLSIRSVEQHALFPVKITVIGDKPSWYTGHFIRKPRLQSAPSYHAITDQLSKTILMSEHPDISQHIVWMMDDIFFLAPFTQQDVMTPRGVKFRRSAKNAWQILKGQTSDELKARGYSDTDYATHAPHYVEKSKLKDVIAEFDLKRRPLIWENVYNNVVRKHASPIRPWLARLKNPLSKEEFFLRTSSACVCNTTEAAWCVGIRDALVEICPFESSVEMAGTFPDQIKSPNVAPDVRRRPPELRDKQAYREHLKRIGVLRR